MTLPQLAKILQYTIQGTRKLAKRLSLPLVTHPTLLQAAFDTSTHHPFALSLRLQHQKPELKAIYCVADLAQQYGKHRKTVIRILQRSGIPMQGVTKKFVYLWDLEQLRKQTHTIEETDSPFDAL